MPSTAIQKAPVEIWQRIFSFITTSSILPNKHDDILEVRPVFFVRCLSDALFRESELAVATLRLVCRSWNQVLQRLRPTVVTGFIPRWVEYMIPARIVSATITSVISFEDSKVAKTM